MTARRLLGAPIFKLALGALAAATLAGCGLVTSTSRSVYLLFDVSGTYVKSVPTATKWANLMITDLQPGDWLGASQIATCSFSEKEVVLQKQLPETPGLADAAKRELFDKLKTYSEGVKSAGYTDIHGALAQAAFELHQRPEEQRYIVLFSDMVEDNAKKCNTSKVALDLKGITVLAANVIKSDPANPEKYFSLLKDWETTVTAAGGTWKLVASADQLPKLVTGS